MKANTTQSPARRRPQGKRIGVYFQMEPELVEAVRDFALQHDTDASKVYRDAVRQKLGRQFNYAPVEPAVP